VYVSEQNAGILVTCQQDSILVEVFELSPTNEAVVGIIGRSQRRFPAKATSIPMCRFSEEGFLSSFANTVARMSCQAIRASKAKITKAGDKHVQERDTTDPMVVKIFSILY
jgi:hypothetical protein